ncbi:MAG: DUF998 domain-containing protein [Anaerolineales bacterium]
MASPILRNFCFAGTGLIILAVFYPLLVYRGRSGERYSLLNHFISELGEVGISRAARAFNAGLLLGGLALLPYIIHLGIAFGGLFGWLGTATGILAVLGVAAVGVFPMNNLKLHTIAAMTYFRAGLAMVFFFGLAILFQPAGRLVIPAAANLLSLVACLAYAAFLAHPLFKKKGPKPAEMLDPQQKPERPRFWASPSLEWLVFFATIAWLFGMACFI